VNDSVPAAIHLIKDIALPPEILTEVGLSHHEIPPVE